MASPIVSIELPARRNTRGFAQVPNSLIENTALLTHAELALALIIARRGEGCAISDDAWSRWTGLKARAKEYAITGLREKGLQVDGRGAGAKFSFAWAEWHKFVLKATPPEISKPRTSGRSVKAPAGAKMHEECAKTGCARLCEECEIAQPVARMAAGGGLIPVPSNAQPVARTSSGKSRGNRPSIAQPVARMSHNYLITLGEIQKRFPTAGDRFMSLLLDKLQTKFKNVPADSDLARLVPLATKKNQHSEGMYLDSLPAVCAVWLLERDKQDTGSNVTAASFDTVIDGLRGLLERERDAFRPTVLELIHTIQTTNWGTMSKVAIGSVLVELQKPLTAITMERFRKEPEYPAIVAEVRQSLINAGMEPHLLESNLDMRLEMMALEKYRVPFVWPA